MPSKSNLQRRQALEEILSLIVARETFRKREIQFLCSEAKPVFVTKTLKQLEGSDLLSSSAKAKDVYYQWTSDRAKFDTEAWIEKLYPNRLQLREERETLAIQVAHMPAQERPRERLLQLGAQHLKTSELFAILIRNGRAGESAVQSGQKLSNAFHNCLERIVEHSPGELKNISSAISMPAFCNIMAGIELGRRVAEAIGTVRPMERINCTRAAVEFCAKHFARLASEARQEEFHIVTLDTKLQPIQSHQITVGTLDASLVHPREVFRPAIRDAASSILLVHNHPSGDPTPSRQDREVTERLKKSGDLLGIQVIDHVIVAKNQCLSLAEAV